MAFYYQAQAPCEEELTLLRVIDEQYLRTPFYGSRKMTIHLVLRIVYFCTGLLTLFKGSVDMD